MKRNVFAAGKNSRAEKSESFAHIAAISSSASKVIVMNNALEREQDYQLALGLCSLLLGEGLLTASEFQKAKHRLMEKFAPPVTGLAFVDKVNKNTQNPSKINVLWR